MSLSSLRLAYKLLSREIFFHVKVALTEVIKKTVVLQVWDWDKDSKTDGIGEVQIPLWQLNLATETNEWKPLHKITGDKQSQGRVGGQTSV